MTTQDNLENMSINELIQHIKDLKEKINELEKQLKFVNNEMPIVTSKLMARSDQVYRGEK